VMIGSLLLWINIYTHLHLVDMKYKLYDPYGKYLGSISNNKIYSPYGKYLGRIEKDGYRDKYGKKKNKTPFKKN